MRAISLIIGALLVILITTEVSAKTAPSEKDTDVSCRLVTGYGESIGHGPNRKAALKNAREKCGESMIDLRFARNTPVDTDEEALLSVQCINLDCQ